MLDRKRAILAKIEATPGTDATPTGAANAVLITGDPKITPLSTETANRELLRPFFGGSPEVVTAAWSEVEFTVELAGSGAVGTPPAWGALMRACGFAEVVTPATRVRYLPISDDLETVTLHFHIDGVRHVLTSAMGSVKLEVVAKQFPKLLFKFVGLFNPATDTPLPNVALSAWKDPVPVLTGNTTATLFGLSDLGIQSLSFDLGASVSYRALINVEEVVFEDRKAVGEALFDMTSVAKKDWFSLVRQGTRGAVLVNHGQSAGNKAIISAPFITLNSPDYQKDKGKTMLKTSFSIDPDLGNDELSITLE